MWQVDGGGVWVESAYTLALWFRGEARRVITCASPRLDDAYQVGERKC